MSEKIRCTMCGKFISYAEIMGGAVRHEFEPDSHFGPERSLWVHKKCGGALRGRRQRPARSARQAVGYGVRHGTR
jgi:hypothetical protein